MSYKIAMLSWPHSPHVFPSYSETRDAIPMPPARKQSIQNTCGQPSTEPPPTSPTNGTRPALTRDHAGPVAFRHRISSQRARTLPRNDLANTSRRTQLHTSAINVAINANWNLRAALALSCSPTCAAKANANGTPPPSRTSEEAQRHAD